MCYFSFDVSDGRFGIIVSIPDHCLPFYFRYEQWTLLIEGSELMHQSFETPAPTGPRIEGTSGT